MFVLDTDTLTLLLHGHQPVSDRVNQASSSVVLTVVTRIEVLQGRFASVLKAADGEQLLRAQQRLAETDADLQRLTILPIDVTAAVEFDRLREDKKLKKIGRADLLIACIALAQRATLVTRNLKHFRQVPDLQVENWAD
jgi:tRNA(fMet)-specific endonuclease VapC